ncbi:MAG: family 20 glycosylhydrolase, partial [Armatimonadetes bacterium]|nr:family 20 glycosylhydrolase [Armatimonadota bacterium]
MFGIIALTLTAITAPEEIAIVPQPFIVAPGQGTFTLASDTIIVADRNELEEARYINEVFGMNLLIDGQSKNKKRIHINMDMRFAKLGEEGYRLGISPSEIEIEASTSKGVFYAIQTLRQLAPASTLRIGDNASIEFPAVTVQDHPRFGWRGLMMDTSRHFMPKDSVLKMIDLLAFHKMNSLHLHLSDDQGWRVEIKKYPKLTEVGSMRKETVVGRNTGQYDGTPHGGFYTQDDIREIVAYATKRHVNVVPEIDMPGHMQAAIAAYPHLGDGKPAEVFTRWGVNPRVLNTKPETIQFCKDVLDEITMLFPSDFIHIGGDECPKIKWKESAFCQELMRREGLKDEFELQSYFVRRIEKHLNSKGKQIIGWDEILEGGVAPNATIMSWRGLEGGIEAAQAGHDVIMTPTSYCYLDYYQSDHPDEPLAIGGFLPLQTVYSFEPIPEALNAEESKYILGTQVNLWTEYIPTREKLEYMLFPRLCASAEIGWSAKDREFGDFVHRLVPHLERLQKMGIRPANHLYDIKSNTSGGDGQVQISLDKLADDAQIHYTLDGSTPSPQSPIYDSAIAIQQSTTLKAQCFKQGEAIGRPWQQAIDWHLATGRTITLSEPPHPKYGSGGAQALINGINGSNERYGDAEWLGFDGKDCKLTIDLGQEQTVHAVHFRFFNGEGQWIYLPRKATVALSTDGQSYRAVGQLEDITGADKVITPTIDFEATPARFVQIEVENFGV